jgi:hypothetical protein
MATLFQKISKTFSLFLNYLFNLLLYIIGSHSFLDKKNKYKLKLVGFEFEASLLKLDKKTVY